MKVAGVRELKNKLSEYLRLVTAGEEVLITDHGEVIAELRKPNTKAYGDLPVTFVTMIREGKMSYGGESDSTLYPTMKALVPRGTAAKLLAEEREDR